MLFLLCSLYKLSSMSVVFDSNAQLNVFAPGLPGLLSVGLVGIEKSGLLMDAICVLLLLLFPLRLSPVSVEFDSSASLNDVAPATPMLFPVDLMKIQSCPK